MQNSPQEKKLKVYPGYELAGKYWHNPKGIPTLALHGWLDNAATFDGLAPLLPELDLLALDFPGHGHSHHKPAESFFHVLDLVIECFLVAKIMHWESFCVIGHSLGAGIASMMAGTFPSRISHLILLDGLGAPHTTTAERAPEQLQHYLETMLAKPTSKAPIYPTIEHAITARLQATPMSPESTRTLVMRGIKEAEGGFTWRTDPRLLRPSPIQLTEHQTVAFLKRIQAPSLFVRPKPGFPYPANLMRQRTAQIPNLTLQSVAGNHHVHLDNPQIVAECIRDFMKL